MIISFQRESDFIRAMDTDSFSVETTLFPAPARQTLKRIKKYIQPTPLLEYHRNEASLIHGGLVCLGHGSTKMLSFSHWEGGCFLTTISIRTSKVPSDRDNRDIFFNLPANHVLLRKRPVALYWPTMEIENRMSTLRRSNKKIKGTFSSTFRGISLHKKLQGRKRWI